MESLYLIGVAVLALFAFVLAIVLFNSLASGCAQGSQCASKHRQNDRHRLRKVPVGMIVDNRITAVKAGIEIPVTRSRRITWPAATLIRSSSL